MQIDGLTKRFGKVTAVNELTLSLEEKTYGLIGPNGAGKTTLLRCIAGLIRPTKGRIIGVDTKEIGYLPQSYGAIGNFTVFDMMKFYSLYRIGRIDEGNLGECLSKVNLEAEVKKKVSQLSGGMLRRLGIAQALIGNPRVLLLDEPTVGLDPKERFSFKKLIKELQGTRTILLSTHILSDVEEVCDEDIILLNGQIQIQGSEEYIKTEVEKQAGKPCESIEKAYLWLVEHL